MHKIVHHARFQELSLLGVPLTLVGNMTLSDESLMAKKGRENFGRNRVSQGEGPTTPRAPSHSADPGQFTLLLSLSAPQAPLSKPPLPLPQLLQARRPPCLGLSEVLLFRATIKFYLLKHDG